MVWRRSCRSLLMLPRQVITRTRASPTQRTGRPRSGSLSCPSSKIEKSGRTQERTSSSTRAARAMWQQTCQVTKAQRPSMKVQTPWYIWLSFPPTQRHQKATSSRTEPSRTGDNL